MSLQKVLLQTQKGAEFLEKLLHISSGWWEWGGVVCPGKWPPQLRGNKEPPPLIPGLQLTRDVLCGTLLVYF